MGAVLTLRDPFGTPGASSTPFVSPEQGSVWLDDFITALVSSFAVNGAGTNATGSAMGANHPGTNTATVAAAGVDASRVQANGNGFYFGGGLFTFMASVQLPILSDGVNNIVVRVGTGDAAGVGDHTDGIYFEYDLATNGDHAWRLCTANNAVRTKSNTGIIPVFGQTQKLEYFVNPLGTQVTCRIGGVVSAAVNTTNIPTTAARLSNFYLQAVKQLGAGGLTFLVDYYGGFQTFSPTR